MKKMTKRQAEKAATLKAKWDAVRERRAAWRKERVEFREAEELRRVARKQAQDEQERRGLRPEEDGTPPAATG
jgi:hypothetical protein